MLGGKSWWAHEKKKIYPIRGEECAKMLHNINMLKQAIDNFYVCRSPVGVDNHSWVGFRSWPKDLIQEQEIYARTVWRDLEKEDSRGRLEP